MRDSQLPGFVYAQSQAAAVQLRVRCRYSLAGSFEPDKLLSMTQKVARILDEAEQLSIEEREELADRLVESLVRDIPPEIHGAHITEVRRRIAQVASGEVSLVSGDEAMLRVRQLVDAARSRG